MRIDKLLCSFALIALASPSNANPATVDPSKDFDCAVLFKFFHKAMVMSKGPADLQEQTLVMNQWFTDQFARDHSVDAIDQREHFFAMVKAMGEDPKAYRDQLNACSARANADPAFEPFAILHRKRAPASR